MMGFAVLTGLLWVLVCDLRSEWGFFCPPNPADSPSLSCHGQGDAHPSEQTTNEPSQDCSHCRTLAQWEDSRFFPHANSPFLEKIWLMDLSWVYGIFTQGRETICPDHFDSVVNATGGLESAPILHTNSRLRI